MKVKTISRNATDHTRERSTDLYQMPRNMNPALHPFAKSREYVRAVNAAKIERMMAKPFLGSLAGHHDGVYALANHPNILDRMYSGAADGEVRIWSLSQQRSTHVISKAHTGVVKGLTAVLKTNQFISCGVDKSIKLWSTNTPDLSTPVTVWQSQYAMNAVDHHRTEPKFACAGGHVVDLYDHERSFPVQSYSWGTDSVGSVRFNPAESDLFASTSTDRAIILYDTRMSTPLKKLVLNLTSNNLCWNPMEPFNFVVGNEDHNAYYFDMRHMDRAVNVFKDHVSAILDVDISPTGQELVTGAYDKTLRIYNIKSGHSRDVYHTKRMQRLWCVRFSMDAKYVLSGSDDGNIRLWKSNASDSLSIQSAREKSAIEMANVLINKYKHLPNVRKITNHRLVPTAIKNARNLKKVMLDARQRKDENVRRNNGAKKNALNPRVPERDKPILGVQE